jgi:aminomethyltransferase
MTHKTPLHPEHLALNAKMAPFAGYDMPIQYPLGVIQEHEWTRGSAGLFDVSHMGQAVISGQGAAEFLSRLTPSSFLKTPLTRAKYTVLTNEQGGIIDDLIITRLREDAFFVVFNAGRKEVDIAWFRKQLPAGVEFKMLDDAALVALQGPKAETVLAREMADLSVRSMPYMTIREAAWRGVPIFISRLGYTGEDGFEISIPAAKAAEFWRALLSHAEVKPVGLAARDSLRLEMGYPLYGHDLSEETTPVEASLSWVMSKDHASYIGAAKASAACTRKRVGIKLTEPGIAREGAELFVGDVRVGTLTSGGFSPTLKVAIGQGYIETAYANAGQQIHAHVRGKKIAAEVAALAFVPAKTKSSTIEATKEKKYG